jgi:hypothetical protein
MKGTFYRDREQNIFSSILYRLRDGDLKREKNHTLHSTQEREGQVASSFIAGLLCLSI